MKVEIDTERLEVLGLNPSQFVYLYCRCRSAKADIPREDLEWLEKAEWGKLTQNGFELREKAYELFEIKDTEKNWYEFKTRFPVKDGSRRLHDDPTKTKDKYMKMITKDVTLHRKILNGLDGEQRARIDASRTNSFFPNWKAMSTWLNQEAWLTYIDYKSDNNTRERTERAK